MGTAGLDRFTQRRLPQRRELRFAQRASQPCAFAWSDKTVAYGCLDWPFDLFFCAEPPYIRRVSLTDYGDKLPMK
ncbi:hypothetical protein ASC75_01370 [Aminobacter sp. DSM 101952]|nr:hypothetical protein ASC75_01370 [Aminobacter sp. DSM 101952]